MSQSYAYHGKLGASKTSGIRASYVAASFDTETVITIQYPTEKQLELTKKMQSYENARGRSFEAVKAHGVSEAKGVD